MVTAILRNVTDGGIGVVVQAETEKQVVAIAKRSLDVSCRKVGLVVPVVRKSTFALAGWTDPNGQVWEIVRVALMREVDHL